MASCGPQGVCGPSPFGPVHGSPPYFSPSYAPLPSSTLRPAFAQGRRVPRAWPALFLKLSPSRTTRAVSIGGLHRLSRRRCLDHVRLRQRSAANAVREPFPPPSQPIHRDEVISGSLSAGLASSPCCERPDRFRCRDRLFARSIPNPRDCPSLVWLLVRDLRQASGRLFPFDLGHRATRAHLGHERGRGLARFHPLGGFLFRPRQRSWPIR